ncbi:CAP domain-containing protein [Nucisporomicrobium flavum]|uniref:CAP domain-containing protein n=1 Tax=Nucisporomicrobium flavum TaxID=2785915 RepID=UPI0018F50118|nr:CAP domain-containing protein [Nucisporomicrobium flavum]
MPTPHRKRTRLIVLSTCALGVLGAGVAGVASAQTVHRPHAVRHASPLLGPATTAAGHHGRGRHWPRPTTSASTRPTAVPTTVAPTTAVPTTSPTSRPATPPTNPPATRPPATTAPATTPPPTTEPPAADAVITAALQHINAARTANGLQPLTLSAELTRASQAHNALMAGGCGLSHQCPGEAGLGDRFTAAGVSWRSAGENIGQGNARDNATEIIAAANGLTDLMLAETPPNDGHRRNLLNAGFTRVGLAVTRDSGGKVWFTQDFVN